MFSDTPNEQTVDGGPLVSRHNNQIDVKILAAFSIIPRAIQTAREAGAAPWPDVFARSAQAGSLSGGVESLTSRASFVEVAS